MTRTSTNAEQETPYAADAEVELASAAEETVARERRIERQAHGSILDLD